MSAATAEFRVLGRLEARSGDDALPLGGRYQRAVLATLLLHANEAVSVDRLIDGLWGEQPPDSAAHAVQVYVSALRKVLGKEAIVRSGDSYVLRVAPDRLDLARFEALVTEARGELSANEPGHAAELLREALALWRGPALADFEYEAFAQAPRARLEELRVAALGARIEADLALARHEELVPDLRLLTAEHPHDERLWELLMLALYRCGRPAEALAAYQSARAALAEELGLEPSPALRQLERKILAHDPSLAMEEQPVRAVLVVPASREQLEQLAAFVEPLGRSKNPHEIILACLENPGGAEALIEPTRVLTNLKARLAERGVEARTAAFTTADRAADVLRLAGRPEIDLLVLGTAISALNGGRLASELSRILAAAPCDVAICLTQAGALPGTQDEPILVPFGAVEHDWAALELGAWLAGADDRPLALLGTAADSRGAQRDASRMLADAGILIQRAAGVSVQPRLVEPGRAGLVDAAQAGGLLVIGLSERWAKEGIGTTRLEVARAAKAPVLLVKRGLRPGGISPPASLTRYRWSVTVGAR